MSTWSAKPYLGRRFGYTKVISAEGKGYSRTVFSCICVACGKSFKRRAHSLVDAIKKGKTPSCGCKKKEIARRKYKQRERELKQLANADLTAEEKAQVKRILNERTYKVRELDRLEAIQCVIADRKKGDLACHGGTVWTL